MTRAHGYAKYRLEGCRCYRCGFEKSLYDEDRRKQIIAGTWQPFVDAEPVRAHVRSLMAAGVGRRRIAVLAGCADSRIRFLLNGRPGKPPQSRIRPALAEKLLWICADAHAPGTSVDATGTKRRIQALACLGHTLTGQAARLGLSTGSYAVLLDRDRVRRSTADKVRVLYDEVSRLPTPAAGFGPSRIRNLARRQGWFPPVAWDEETIDDPAAAPALIPPVEGSDPAADEWAIQHVYAGHTTAAGLDSATRGELARRLVHDGWTYTRIGGLLGVGRDRVRQLAEAAR